ncbi:MAG: cystathionine gamma-synthase [Planctomycetes bacterium]|nr:cystathionine gamma-synthase [Planctomycetota bacterium]
MSRPRALSTAAVRAGVGRDAQFGSVMPPLHLSVNYTFEAFGRRRQYDYSRTANPTRDQLADALASLEGGAGATLTNTGMSAVSLVLQLLRPGDLLVAPHDCYGGTHRLISALANKNHFEAVFVDQNDPSALDAALARGPRLLWIETPSNPLLRIVDIECLAAAARARGALVAVDNTFLSPILQNPIALGADLVVHSTTKYINGHSDALGGAVVARDAALAENLAWWANCTGVTAAAFDSYLTMRGLRTLPARMRAHERNAAAVARYLQKHPGVAHVYYPGLPDHPGHAIARRQQRGFGAMIGFEIAADYDMERFVNSLQLFSLAESLGGVESLVAHPATMTHASMAPAARARAGISNRLLRLSIGVEDLRDLRGDLRRAFALAAPPMDIIKKQSLQELADIEAEK